MREQTVAMWCLIDDVLPAIRPNSAPDPDPRQPLSEAQRLTTALVAALGALYCRLKTGAGVRKASDSSSVS